MPSVFANGGWRERWVLSYIFDYVVIILLIGGFSLLDFAQPFNQPFSLDNPSLQYPYADPERVPALWAGVIACLFPLACIICWTLFIDGLFSHHKPRTNRSRIMGGPWSLDDRLWEMNCGILGLGLSVAFAICVTGALKNTTGKPRPDIIARCKPPSDAKNPHWGLVTSKICTGDKHILKDGFKSWPSGHASTSFAGLGYLAIFLAGKLHICDNRGEVWKTAIVLIPLLAASLITVSRIMDARHHPFDVISGSILGIISAWVSYRQYFPSITQPEHKGRAYPRRTWGTETADHVIAGGLYTTTYNPRTLEEGGRTGSSESIDSETGVSRKRGPGGQSAGLGAGIGLGVPGPYNTRSRTFDPPHEDYEMDEHMGRRASTFDAGGVPPRPPPHMQVHDNNFRDSVDMGDSRRTSGPDSPKGMRLGRLSPPPAQDKKEEAGV